MAEGARLERVYTGNRIEGSNPSLSAIFQHKIDRNRGAGLTGPGAAIARPAALTRVFDVKDVS